MMSEHSAFSVTREYRFAVVDSTAFDLLPEGIIAEPLVPKGLEQSAHLMPGLIHLHKLSTDRLNAFYTFLNEANNRSQISSAAILVATSSEAPSFVRHWNAVQLPKQTGRHKFWLRIHDSRVLHQLLRILDPMQRRGLFGQAHAFHYWLGNGWTTALRNSIEGANSGASSIGPAGWDWQRIEHIGIVNRALYRAEIHDLSALAKQGALAEQLINRAINDHGLTENTDLIEYAARGLIFGPLFDEHPKITAAITTITPLECTSLSDRFALIEEEVWASFHEPLNSASQTKYELNEDM